MNLQGRNFLKLLDYSKEEIRYLLDLSKDFKNKKKQIKEHIVEIEFIYFFKNWFVLLVVK